MNEMLRQNATRTKDQEQIVRDFDSLFTDRTEEPMILYRGTSVKDFTPFYSGNFLNYPAFMSTSSSLGSAVGFLNTVSANDEKLILKISVPASQTCIRPQNFNGEQEVILPRDLRFEIEDWTTEGLEQLQLETAPFEIEKCLLLTIKGNVT